LLWDAYLLVALFSWLIFHPCFEKFSVTFGTPCLPHGSQHLLMTWHVTSVNRSHQG
jgi:hypothetical protein